MRRYFFVLFSLLAIAVICLSGCTSNSGTATQGNAGTSDRDIILQGIAAGEQSCINHLSAGVSTDKCRVTSTNKEIIVSQILADTDAHEQECLSGISQSTDPGTCTVSSATKQAAAERSAICIDNVGNNNVAAVRNCVDTSFAAVT